MGILIFLLTVRAEAMSADSVFVRKLNQARTPAQIHILQTEFEDLKVARRACRMQMQSHTIPSACFEALQRESRWGLATNTKALRSKLDSLCEEAAGNFTGTLESIDERPLSPACRASLASGRKIERYKSGELVRDLN